MQCLNFRKCSISHSLYYHYAIKPVSEIREAENEIKYNVSYVLEIEGRSTAGAHSRETSQKQGGFPKGPSLRSCCLGWLQRQKFTKETRDREYTRQDEGLEAHAYDRNHHRVAGRMLLGRIWKLN